MQKYTKDSAIDELRKLESRLISKTEYFAENNAEGIARLLLALDSKFYTLGTKLED